MYEQEMTAVKQIVMESSMKGGLKKPPKVLVSKEVKLAGARGFRNQLLVGEYLLSQLQKGVFSIDDLKASIAHEIGHLMPSHLPWYQRIFKNLHVTILYLALMAAMFFMYYFFLSMLAQPWALLITLIASLPFLPWAIRKIERPFELEADRKAASLIGNEALAKSIINKSSQWHECKLGPFGTLAELEEILSHPSLSERLENIGFELKLEKEKLK